MIQMPVSSDIAEYRFDYARPSADNAMNNTFSRHALSISRDEMIPRE